MESRFMLLDRIYCLSTNPRTKKKLPVLVWYFEFLFNLQSWHANMCAVRYYQQSFHKMSYNTVIPVHSIHSWQLCAMCGLQCDIYVPLNIKMKLRCPAAVRFFCQIQQVSDRILFCQNKNNITMTSLWPSQRLKEKNHNARPNGDVIFVCHLNDPST